MCAIYAYIDPSSHTNVGKYDNPMECLGYGSFDLHKTGCDRVRRSLLRRRTLKVFGLFTARMLAERLCYSQCQTLQR